ncbi:MAG: hypothetical protein MJA30_24010, partial [Cytophagales bacterium]|nr:hypothetical protein [Cytophagales bacterium]
AAAAVGCIGPRVANPPWPDLRNGCPPGWGLGPLATPNSIPVSWDSGNPSNPPAAATAAATAAAAAAAIPADAQQRVASLELLVGRSAACTGVGSSTGCSAAVDGWWCGLHPVSSCQRVVGYVTRGCSRGIGSRVGSWYSRELHAVAAVAAAAAAAAAAIAAVGDEFWLAACAGRWLRSYSRSRERY